MKSLNTKKLVKTLNKVFADKKFIYDMVSNCENIDQMEYVMGKILAYLIETRDKKIYSYKDMQDILDKCEYECPEPKNKKKKESNGDALVRNIIDEGFVTHSFNGFNLEKVKKNGLGSDKIYDNELSNELAKLEKDLGVSDFLKEQTNESSEIYYTSPGANSIHYAMKQSPERLFQGPLHQDNPLPIKVGETKKDYYMRVVASKINNKECSPEEKQAIMKNAENVITKFCSKRPQIALIPIDSKNYSLKANFAFDQEESVSLKDHLSQQANGNMESWATTRFFSHCLGGSGDNNCTNLVSTGVKIPASELGFVSVPDSFELLQIKAKQKGLKQGEKFDLISLEKVEEKEEKLDNSIENKPVIEKVSKMELEKTKEEMERDNPSMPKGENLVASRQHTKSQRLNKKAEESSMSEDSYTLSR